MLNLTQHVKAALCAHLSQQRETKVVLAYSGGLDSHVLLDVLAPLCRSLMLPLQAVHVHHGISVHADDWARFCQEQCRVRQVDFRVRHVTLALTGNLEQQARTARYAALADFVDTANTLLVTAHHADDQLETLLLALKRGAGAMGLAAMPMSRAFALGTLLRPLLAISRQQLTEYASQRGLVWVEDDSNTDTRFDRNFLRHHVTPLLQQRWPTFSQTAARSVQHLQQTLVLAEHYTSQALATCVEGLRLNLQTLAQLHPLQQDMVLRAWLKSDGKNPDTQWLDVLKSEVVHARIDAAPQLAIGGSWVRRFRHYLYLTPELTERQPGIYGSVSTGEALALAEGQLIWTAEAEQGAMPVGDNTTYQLAFGLMSMPFKPEGHLTKPLKQWMKYWQVPPWQRGQIPLLIRDGELVLVAGLASRYRAEQAVAWIRWQPSTL